MKDNKNTCKHSNFQGFAAICHSGTQASIATNVPIFNVNAAHGLVVIAKFRHIYSLHICLAPTVQEGSANIVKGWEKQIFIYLFTSSSSSKRLRWSSG